MGEGLKATSCTSKGIHYCNCIERCSQHPKVKLHQMVLHGWKTRVQESQQVAWAKVYGKKESGEHGLVPEAVLRSTKEVAHKRQGAMHQVCRQLPPLPGLGH